MTHAHHTALLVPAFLALSALAAPAEDIGPAMQAFLEDSIMPFAADPVILTAVAAQNARTAALALPDIDALDQAWRAEVGLSPAPTIQPVLENPASDFLRARVEAAQGMITEVIVMDARGLNVAASAVTSDYWQGDEDKFTETFGRGPGAVHTGEIEHDESTGIYQAQVSFTLVDPDSGDGIGAMTVGVNAEALF